MHALDTALARSNVRLGVAPRLRWTAAAVCGLASLVQAQEGQDVAERYRIDGNRLQFTDVYTGAFLDDRRVVLADRADKQVLVFDRGILSARLGRSGEGPGEFRAVSRIQPAAEGVRVFDAVLRRTTLLPFDRGEARTTVLPSSATWGRLWPPTAGPAPQGMPIPLAAREEGALVVRLDPPSGARPGSTPSPYAGQVVIAVADADGRLQRVLGHAPGPAECFLLVRTPRVSEIVQKPACELPAIGSSLDGGYVAFAHAIRRFSDRADVRVLLVATSGDTVLNRVISMPTIEVDRRVRDSLEAAFERRIARIPGASRQSISYSVPRTLPPVTKVLITPDRTVWLRGSPGAGRVPWVGVGDGSHGVEQISLPVELVVLDIRGKLLLAVEQDEDGVPDVLVLSRQ